MSEWVLLRGLSRQQGHWGHFVDCLQAQTHQSVRCEDLPGFGERYRQASPRSIGRIAEQIADAVFRAASPVNLLGISMGGMVALELARRWPEQCNCLVMVNSSFRPYARLHHRLRPRAYMRVVQALLHPSERASEAQILRLSSHRHRENTEVLDTWTHLRARHPPRRHAVLNQLLAAGRYGYLGPKPVNRVLLLASREDTLVNVRCSQRIADAWQAELRLHPDAGHDLALDDPEWLASEIAHWHQRTLPC